MTAFYDLSHANPSLELKNRSKGFLTPLITEGKFPAPWGVTVFLVDERIHTQESQRNGADVPPGVSSEVQKSGV